jgi:hypothetical protein
MYQCRKRLTLITNGSEYYILLTGYEPKMCHICIPDSSARSIDFLSKLAQLVSNNVILPSGTRANDSPPRAPDGTQMPIYFFTESFHDKLGRLESPFCSQISHKFSEDTFRILINKFSLLILNRANVVLSCRKLSTRFLPVSDSGKLLVNR